MKSERRDHCCLCQKSKLQVRKLIVGLDGAICSDCIDLCNDILHNAKTNGPEVFQGGWDGTVTVEPSNRDVFQSARDVHNVLGVLADLIRGYKPTRDEEGKS